MINGLVIGALCVVGTLSAVTFLFCLSFARRLRQMASDPRFSSGATSSLLPARGTEVRAFEAIALDGTVISKDRLLAPTTVAIFVSTTCEACRRLSKQLLTRPLDEPTVVFVNGTDPDDPARVPTFASAFSPVAGHVVWAGDDDSVRVAFGVEAFPTLLRVSKGLITDTAFALKDFTPDPKRVLVDTTQRS